MGSGLLRCARLCSPLGSKASWMPSWRAEVPWPLGLPNSRVALRERGTDTAFNGFTCSQTRRMGLPYDDEWDCHNWWVGVGCLISGVSVGRASSPIKDMMLKPIRGVRGFYNGTTQRFTTSWSQRQIYILVHLVHSSQLNRMRVQHRSILVESNVFCWIDFDGPIDEMSWIPGPHPLNNMLFVFLLRIREATAKQSETRGPPPVGINWFSETVLRWSLAIAVLWCIPRAPRGSRRPWWLATTTWSLRCAPSWKSQAGLVKWRDSSASPCETSTGGQKRFASLHDFMNHLEEG